MLVPVKVINLLLPKTKASCGHWSPSGACSQGTILGIPAPRGSAPSSTAEHGPAQCLICFPGINGLVVPVLWKTQHLLLAPLQPPGKGIWRGLRGGNGGNQVIHQPHRFWMTWHAGCVATASCQRVGAGLQLSAGLKGRGTLEGTPKSQGT